MPGGPYTRHESDWKDYPDTSTPVDAAFLDALELWLEGHAATGTTGAHPASSITISDAGGLYTATDVEAALQEIQTDAILDTLIDAKGDLIVGTAADTPARKAVGGDGKALLAASGEADGLHWDYPPGYEFGVSSVTANASVSSTAEGTQDTLATVSVTADGDALILEYSSPRVALPAVASIGMVISLWEGGTNIARLGVLLNNGEATGTLSVPVLVRHRFTPTAAAHTYTVKAYMTATGTGTVYGGVGTGGAGINVPALLRVVKA